MSLTNAFHDAVENGNVVLVRIMMKNSLLADPTFREFAEMEKAAGGMDGLYQAHDGRPFITDSAQWNETYMYDLMAQVVENFSHERIAHLKDVVRCLRPAASPHEPRTGSSQVVVGAVAGGVAGGVIGSVIAAAVEASALVGAAAGVVAGAAAGAVIAAVVTGGKE